MLKAIKKYWFVFFFIFIFFLISIILILVFEPIQSGRSKHAPVVRAASNLATAINSSNQIAGGRYGVALFGDTAEGAIIDVVGTPLNAMPDGEDEIAELTAVTVVFMPVDENKPNGIQMIYFIVPSGETDEPVETLTVAFSSRELAIMAQQVVFIRPPLADGSVPSAYVDKALVYELEYRR